MNFGKWHKVRAQSGAYEKTKIAALPTLGVEPRLAEVHRATTKRPPYLQRLPTGCSISLKLRQNIT
ncbi:MAG TPA: hypothetical protein VMY41_01725, partial [Thermohalobaculum sp.]|nr:hypothetical protein [Thermohalobaculum sp.]